MLSKKPDETKKLVSQKLKEEKEEIQLSDKPRMTIVKTKEPENNDVVIEEPTAMKELEAITEAEPSVKQEPKTEKKVEEDGNQPVPR